MINLNCLLFGMTIFLSSDLYSRVRLMMILSSFATMIHILIGQSLPILTIRYLSMQHEWRCFVEPKFLYLLPYGYFALRSRQNSSTGVVFLNKHWPK